MSSVQAWVTTTIPKQPAVYVLQAQRRVDLLTGAVKHSNRKPVRDMLISETVQHAVHRGWTMPEDADALENNDRAGLSWTPTEDHDLVMGFCEGATPDELAAKHGRTKNAVALRLANEHGLLYKQRGGGFYVKATRKLWE